MNILWAHTGAIGLNLITYIFKSQRDTKYPSTAFLELVPMNQVHVLARAVPPVLQRMCVLPVIHFAS